MSQTLETVRRNRLNDAKQSLEALNAHVADLRRAHADAVDAYENARAVKDDIAAELDDAQSRQRQASERLNQLVQSLRRDVVKKLPADVLLHVFEQATYATFLNEDDNSTNFPDETGLAKEVAFTLSAVCSQWRRTAVNHAPLWSRIGLRCSERAAPSAAHLDLVKLLLQRSRSFPLSINLLWSRFHHWHISGVARHLLNELFLHAARWRVFYLHLPDAQKLRDALMIFKGPMPMLQRISVVVADPDAPAADSIDDDYLPFAPKLTALRLGGSHGFVPLSTCRWGALRHLSITGPLAFEHAWSLLTVAAATLQSLRLVMEQSPPDAFAFSPLLFPKLKTLTLATGPQSDSFVASLQLPQLEHIYTHGALLRLCPYWQPFFERVAPTVRHLSLQGEINLSVLRQGRGLTRLERLSIGDMEVDSTVHDEAFADRQLWVDEALWPALVSVSLSNTARNIGDRVLPMIRWRTEQLAAQAPGETRPARLKEFTVGDPAAPQWLKAEITRLIAAGAAAEQGLSQSESLASS